MTEETETPKKKEVDFKVKTPEEILWEKATNEITTMIKELENNLTLNKKFLETAEEQLRLAKTKK